MAQQHSHRGRAAEQSGGEQSSEAARRTLSLPAPVRERGHWRVGGSACEGRLTDQDGPGQTLDEAHFGSPLGPLAPWRPCAGLSVLGPTLACSLLKLRVQGGHSTALDGQGLADACTACGSSAIYLIYHALMALDSASASLKTATAPSPLCPLHRNVYTHTLHTQLSLTLLHACRRLLLLQCLTSLTTPASACAPAATHFSNHWCVAHQRLRFHPTPSSI